MSQPMHHEEHHTLMEGAIGLAGDWVASVANTAPSSSVAFTLALLVSFAGLASPLAVLVAGILMLLVALGYSRLNNWAPHAGAPYHWVGRAVHPVLGYATGILAILAATAANVGNITLAGTYFLGVVFPGQTFSNEVVWLFSAAIMALVIYIAVRGIRPSIEVQTAIIVFEYVVVILFVVLALKRELIDQVAGTTIPSLSAFLPSTSSNGFSGLANAAVVCGFLYAGWEAPLILGEESKNAHFNPGRAAILGVTFLMVWYIVLIIVFQGIAAPGDIAAHGTDILGYAGSLLLPDPFGRLLGLAVLSAVFATTQMQLTESSRVVFAMARGSPAADRVEDPPAVPHALGRGDRARRHPAARADPVPLHLGRHHGHRLHHQRRRPAVPAHVRDHRVRLRLVLPAPAGDHDPQPPRERRPAARRWPRRPGPVPVRHREPAGPSVIGHGPPGRRLCGLGHSGAGRRQGSLLHGCAADARVAGGCSRDDRHVASPAGHRRRVNAARSGRSTSSSLSRRG